MSKNMNAIRTATKNTVPINVIKKILFSYLRCMKYSSTKLDFTDATIRATQIFSQPRSIFETRIVITVRIKRIPSMPSKFR